MNEHRTRQQSHRRPIPFHPVLFAVAPILFVYTFNATKTPIDPRELLVPISLSVAMTAALWTCLWLLFRNASLAASVVSFYLVLFFSYGHVETSLRRGTTSHVWTVLLPFWLLLMAAGTWVAAQRSRSRAERSQAGLTVLLNSIASAVLVVNLATGVQAFAYRPPRRDRVSAPALTAKDADHPDIYYVILDGYARSDVLRSIYHYDNSGFLDSLRRMGFYVAEKSRSNYGQTVLSLASSLNLVHLDSIACALGSESHDKRPLADAVTGSRLVAFLRQRGYAVMAFATGYGPTELRDAEFYRAPPWAASEFRNVLLSTTAVPSLLEALGMRTLFDLHRERILYALDHLVDAVHVNQPVFAFAHIVAPHPPFVLGTANERRARNDVYTLLDGGGLHEMNQAQQADYVAGYREQLASLNERVLSVVEKILVQSAAHPLIIIQADHGPGSRLDWRTPERTDMVERSSILSTYYFPDQNYSRLYDSITPVNTFRVVLSQYFDTTLTLLPDRSRFSSMSRPYHFYDVDRAESHRSTGRPAGPIGKP